MAAHTMNTLDRFTSHVNKSAPEGCWEWSAYVRPNGYGRFMLSPGHAVYAHRFSYDIENVDAPVGDDVPLDHLCRNRRCVNPAHLEPVSQRENLLRSPLTITSRNAAKTTCPSGHPLDGKKKNGWRYCKTCKRDSRRKAITH